jgi:hypothetical protein
LLARDPKNELYARAPRYRLPAELVRDVALAASGLLSRKIGGPSVFPPQPEGVWDIPFNADRWVTDTGENRYRRGLYTFWRRTAPYPSMVAFDAHSREVCVAMRPRTNTPLQSLVLLNDPAYMEAAVALAQRMAARGKGNLQASLRYGFRCCTAREPTPAELQRLERLYRQMRERYAKQPDAARKLVGQARRAHAPRSRWSPTRCSIWTKPSRGSSTRAAAGRVHFPVMDLSTLNLEQLEAVLHKDGSLLVFAGAGSGKTRVITYRIAHLIREHGVRPAPHLGGHLHQQGGGRTERASEPPAGRVRGARAVGRHLPRDLRPNLARERTRDQTSHSNFVVYDDGDQLEVVRRVLIDLNIDEKQIGARPIRYAISRAKERLISPHEYRESASDYFERIVASVYERYETYLRAANALDFDDLINKVIELLETQPHARERYQDQFRYILVDEYQDVNYAQYVLTRLLAERHRNLCVVGDDDQSIYGFRGAEVELILRFEKDFPDAKVIKLEQNYRSTQVILDAAFKVVSENRFRAPKRLWTERRGGAPITLTPTSDEEAEARIVADYIYREVQLGRRRYGDFAVLVPHERPIARLRGTLYARAYPLSAGRRAALLRPQGGQGCAGVPALAGEPRRFAEPAAHHQHAAA